MILMSLKLEKLARGKILILKNCYEYTTKIDVMKTIAFNKSCCKIASVSSKDQEKRNDGKNVMTTENQKKCVWVQ